MNNFNYIFELEDEDNNKTYEVELNIKYDIDNDGLGWYDYGSARCFDAGQNFASIEDYSISSVFEVIGGKLQKENKKDDKYLENLIDNHYTCFIDTITEKIEQQDFRDMYEED